MPCCHNLDTVLLSHVAASLLRCRPPQGPKLTFECHSCAAQGALSQERAEHAQLVASLRAMIGSLQSSGDTETQLRSQLISLAEKVAVLTAAQVGRAASCACWCWGQQSGSNAVAQACEAGGYACKAAITEPAQPSTSILVP
jgi:hypothetical protein